MDHLTKILEQAILEDCPQQDITTDCLQLPDFQTNAKIISKQHGLFYGAEIVHTLASIYGFHIHQCYKNGDTIRPNDLVIHFECSHHLCLKIERVLLNFIQRLSGVSTYTHRFVTALRNPAIKVMDTRKTTPGLRDLEKKAVVAGGGYNHRRNLSDMVLIKENHLKVLEHNHQLSQLGTLLSQQKKHYPDIDIEIEIENLDQLHQFDLSMVDYILLDNFNVDDISKAASICNTKRYSAKLEVSGNISLDPIHLYKELPIQRISIGALTHSVPAFDFSMLIA